MLNSKLYVWRDTCELLWSSAEVSEMTDTVVSIVFGLQTELVVAISVFFGAEAFALIQRTSQLPVETAFATLLCALLSNLIFAAMAMSIPKYLPHLSLVLPWALPLVIGVAQSYTSSEISEKNTSLIFLKGAAMTYCAMTVVYCLIRKHISVPISILKATIKSMRVHPWLLTQSVMVSMVSSLLTFTWIIAAMGVYQWVKNQKVLRPCVFLEEHNSTRSFGHVTEMHKAERQALCEEEPPIHPLLISFFAFYILWMQQTCKNIIQVATASTIAAWWDDKGRSVPTSLHSALRVPFQVICKQSLQAPFAQVYDWMVSFICERKEKEVEHRTRAQKLGNKGIGEKSFFVYLGMFGEEMDFEVDNTVHSRGGIIFSIQLATLAIAVTTATLVWSITNTIGDRPSIGLFQMAFVFGWVSGSALLTIFEAAAIATLVSVTNFQPDGHLLKTRIYFALKKEAAQLFGKDREKKA